MDIDLQFEWDEAKAVANFQKHGVGFDEAQTVFSDPAAITVFDQSHSEDEDRFVDVGMSRRGRILAVVYT